MIPTIVLLSGGMDSAVALAWVMKERPGFGPVDAITFDYDQRNRREFEAARTVWSHCVERDTRGQLHHHGFLMMPPGFFEGGTIVGFGDVQKYATVEEAIQNTPKDESYVPMRNLVLITIAAHKMMARHPEAPEVAVVIGVRGRTDPHLPPGFPDCTHKSMLWMGQALSHGSGRQIHVIDPCNTIGSREGTILYAVNLDGGMKLLSLTTTCYNGSPPCGKCLPCLRRAQAFANLNMKDPAYE